MTLEDTFQRIVSVVKQPKFYVPREYKTIGGMWTVDTWVRDEVTVQVMDEGYTTRIIAPGIQVTNSYPSPISFQRGDKEMLYKLLKDMQ